MPTSTEHPRAIPRQLDVPVREWLWEAFTPEARKLLLDTYTYLRQYEHGPVPKETGHPK